MKIKLVGIPSYAGGLYSGTDMTPDALREAGLVQMLNRQKTEVEDLGDIPVSSFMPRNNVPPIRNWPAPRIIWDEMIKQSENWFKDDEFTLIIGGDCSIITGATKGLYNKYKNNTYLICIDAHLDAVKPSPEKCIGAAAMGLWFLCNNNMFFSKPEDFDGSHVHVLGIQHNYAETYGSTLYSLENLRKRGLEQTAASVLSSLPEIARIFIHLDLDVICKTDLHAVYSPSNEGLSLEEAKTLLSDILLDKRVIGMEVAEFSGIKDFDGTQAIELARLLSEILIKR
ncbi:arginase family protein [Clostridium swellfunianum]|uniref:arginase family protein n=1 Tax=Clostridium swellfunianum TaxID=1367462 RepID=UPI002030B255|nr:arginase family protein [Clostridium swellfunianum]MCM0650986.1 arginase family protein [Clostridium swellfunianum]